MKKELALRMKVMWATKMIAVRAIFHIHQYSDRIINGSITCNVELHSTINAQQSNLKRQQTMIKSIFWPCLITFVALVDQAHREDVGKENCDFYACLHNVCRVCVTKVPKIKLKKFSLSSPYLI